MSLRLRQMEPEPGDRSGAASPGPGGAEQAAPSASGGSPMPPPHEPPHQPSDDIDRWLATFSALARLPEARRAAVTDELEDHLRCRSRDLMLRGASEPEAIRTSIAELGEAAELAARFRLAARTPIWRHVMTFSILGISAAALTLSVIAIAGAPAQEAGQPTGVIFRSPSLQAEATSAALDDIRLQLDLQDEPIESFFRRVGEAAGKPVFAHWSNLPAAADEQITLQVGEASFPTALRLINTRLGYEGSDDAIDFRIRDGVLEFATRNYFDRQEAQLVRYDLAPVLVRATPDEIVDLIHNLVDPHSWEANGGVTASLHMAGDQMFIKAPQRMFPKIEWILAQFTEETKPAAEEDRTAAKRSLESAQKLRVISVLVHRSASMRGRFPDLAEDLIGHVATPEQLTTPGGEQYWLDIPAMETMDSRRIVGYDRGAYARGEDVPALFADGHIERLAPVRFRDLTEAAPNSDTDFDLPGQQVGAAPATAPVRFTAASRK